MNSRHQRVTLVYAVCVMSTLSVAISGCKEDMKDVYQKAMNAYQDGEYQEAVTLFERILKEYPDHSLSRKARYELGKMYLYHLQEPELALKHLQELYAQSQPGTYSLEALKLIGAIYDKSLNDCVNGIEAYQLLLREYRSEIDGGEYQFAIAECYFKLHEYPQAIQEYQSLVDRYPDNTHTLTARFQMANSHALLEDWEQASVLHEQLLASENISKQLATNVKLELAFCYEQQERFEDALRVYQELQDMASEDIVLDTALLTRKIERVEAAIEESQQGPGEVDWKRR